MNFRPVLYVVGILIGILSVTMLIPMLVDLYHGSSDWLVFLFCSIVTAFFSGALIISNYSDNNNISIKQAFVLTTLSWIAVATFGALPFFFSELESSFTDSFFESMSGVTTTGATIFTELSSMPKGLLLWRGLLQWLGGVGFIVMALSLLPFLKVGGMQLFRSESSENEKALPRAAQLATSIAFTYLAFSLMCMICYAVAGLEILEASIHAMTTIATGGFSTYDTSLAGFESIWIEIVAIVFMVISGMPYIILHMALMGKVFPFLKDTQIRTYLSIILFSITVMVIYMVFHQSYDFSDALRLSSFNVVSIISGTGYVNGDYGSWGGFAVSLMFFLMVVGGCAGSTSCGIKIFRFQILFSIMQTQFKKLLHPYGVFIPHYNGKPIPKGVPMSVMGFFFIYALTFSFGVMLLSFTGMDFLSAMSGAASCLSNVGPALGDIIGPTGTYHPLSDSAKWILSFLMLLGRLELFTVLIVFTPNFWKY